LASGSWAFPEAGGGFGEPTATEFGLSRLVPLELLGGVCRRLNAGDER